MKISFNKKYTTIAIYAALLILFTIVCINAVIVRPVGLFSLWDSIKEIIKTIFYALVIAYFLAPVMDFFSKRALIFIQRKSENPFIRKLISLVLTFAIIPLLSCPTTVTTAFIKKTSCFFFPLIIAYIVLFCKTKARFR